MHFLVTFYLQNVEDVRTDRLRYFDFCAITPWVLRFVLRRLQFKHNLRKVRRTFLILKRIRLSFLLIAKIKRREIGYRRLLILWMSNSRRKRFHQGKGNKKWPKGNNHTARYNESWFYLLYNNIYNKNTISFEKQFSLQLYSNFI